MLQNGNFSSRNWRNIKAKKLNLINQEPEGWHLEWLDPGDLLYDDNNSAKAEGVPECVHKLSKQLPEHERLGQPGALILDGDATYKIFSATASFGATRISSCCGGQAT